MNQLDPKIAADIAIIVNGLMVAKSKIESARTANDTEQLEVWLNVCARKSVKLADDFGIKLPNYKWAHDHLARQV